MSKKVTKILPINSASVSNFEMHTRTEVQALIDQILGTDSKTLNPAVKIPLLTFGFWQLKYPIKHPDGTFGPSNLLPDYVQPVIDLLTVKGDLAPPPVPPSQEDVTKESIENLPTQTVDASIPMIANLEAP